MFVVFGGETGSYITTNGTNIKFCMEVSIQSMMKSSPWLAELVLVQLLAISTGHSTAGLWPVTLSRTTSTRCQL